MFSDTREIAIAAGIAAVRAAVQTHKEPRNKPSSDHDSSVPLAAIPFSPDQLPEVWPVRNLPPLQMMEQFQKSLETVQGRFFSAESAAAMCDILDRLVTEHSIHSLVVSQNDRFVSITPWLETLKQSKGISVCTVLSSSGVAQIEAGDVERNEVAKNTVATADVAILSAMFLVADTGSCLVSATTAMERWCCYLPPICIILARLSDLREHLPHVWRELFGSGKKTGMETGTETATATGVSSPDQRTEQGQNSTVLLPSQGEYVWITGPSRTADIEKILILGVHGPKQLFVIVDTSC